MLLLIDLLVALGGLVHFEIADCEREAYQDLRGDTPVFRAIELNVTRCSVEADMARWLHHGVSVEFREARYHPGFYAHDWMPLPV